MVKDAEAKLQEQVENIDDHELVTLNPEGTRTLKLRRAIKLKDGDLEELTFKEEMQVADLEESDRGKGDIASAARLIASLTGISYANIRKMRSDDFQTAGIIVARLSGNAEATGGTS